MAAVQKSKDPNFFEDLGYIFWITFFEKCTKTIENPKIQI